eukprot:gene7908-1411_t
MCNGRRSTGGVLRLAAVLLGAHCAAAHLATLSCICPALSAPHHPLRCRHLACFVALPELLVCSTHAPASPPRHADDRCRLPVGIAAVSGPPCWPDCTLAQLKGATSCHLCEEAVPAPWTPRALGPAAVPDALKDHPAPAPTPATLQGFRNPINVMDDLPNTVCPGQGKTFDLPLSTLKDKLDKPYCVPKCTLPPNMDSSTLPGCNFGQVGCTLMDLQMHFEPPVTCGRGQSGRPMSLVKALCDPATGMFDFQLCLPPGPSPTDSVDVLAQGACPEAYAIPGADGDGGSGAIIAGVLVTLFIMLSCAGLAVAGLWWHRDRRRKAKIAAFGPASGIPSPCTDPRAKRSHCLVLRKRWSHKRLPGQLQPSRPLSTCSAWLYPGPILTHLPVSSATIGKLDLVMTKETLGAGSFGKIFLGIDSNTGRQVYCAEMLSPHVSNSRATSLHPSFPLAPHDPQLIAVKEVRPENCDMTTSLQREIDLMASIAHKNIVSYLGWVEGDRNAWLILMEYCAGGSMWRQLGLMGTVPKAMVQKVGRECLDGLECLHSQGTIIYMSPEVLQQASSFPVDIWALFLSPHCAVVSGAADLTSVKTRIASQALTLMHLITGVAPYDQLGLENNVQFVFHIGNMDLFEVPKDLQPELAELVSVCTTIDPSLRPKAGPMRDHPFFYS